MKILLAALFVGLLATTSYAEDRRQFLQQQQRQQQAEQAAVLDKSSFWLIIDFIVGASKQHWSFNTVKN
jgi:hypothetical protein